jgi:hypothetical protein
MTRPASSGSCCVSLLSSLWSCDSSSHDEDLVEARNTLSIATTKVKELTIALDDMLGWPPDTEAQLVPPDPRCENISLKEATDKTFASNPIGNHHSISLRLSVLPVIRVPWCS